MKWQVRRKGSGWRMCHDARCPAPAGASVVLMGLALAACGPVTAASPLPGFTGYDWQVVTISHDGTATRIPASLPVVLQFSPDGHFGVIDSVNVLNGSYRTTGNGFTVSGMGTTLAGYAGRNPTILLEINAIGSFNDGVHATAKLTRDLLVVGVGSYTLTCRRRGRQSELLTTGPAGGQ